MRLGKRYIGVIDRQDGAVFEWLDATTAYDMSLTVDLDRLPRADATDQDLVRHHREQAKYHAEEAARLTQDDVDAKQAAFEWHESQQSWHAERTLRLETACSTVKAQRGDAEMVQLRRECERMRAVCDRSVNLIDGWGRRAAPADLRGVGELANAVDAYRSAAPIASQPTPTLTPAEWSALEELRHVARNTNRDRAVIAYALTPAARDALVTAIDKLTKARST